MEQSIDAATATEQLFALYKNDVYRYARFALGDSTVAEDIVKEVFLRVLKAWDRYRGDASPKTWLWIIVRSCIIDYTRKHKRDRYQQLFVEEFGGITHTQPSDGIHGGAVVSRTTRMALGLSAGFTVYMIYLFWAWFVFKSWGTITFYVVPVFNFRQPGESFLSWINLTVSITLVLWIVWIVLFVKDSKRN